MKEKKSINPIPPTLREKKRYILFNVEAHEKITKEMLERAISQIFVSSFGSLETAKISPMLIEFNSSNGKGIIKCNKNKTEVVKKILLKLVQIQGNKIIIKTLKTSGTLKKLRSSC